MRLAYTLLLTAAVAATTAYFIRPASTTSASTQESAYQRVVDSGVLRCGYAVAPPFFQQDPVTKTFSGINYDLIMALAKTLDLKVEWTEETGWGNFIAGLDANRFDAFCTTVWPEAGRLKHAALTNPMFYSSAQVVVRADDTRFDNNLARLNDPAHKVVVVEADVTQELAARHLPKATTHRLGQDTASAAQMLLEVASGKADATFAFSGLLEDFNKTNPGLLKYVPGVAAVQVFPEALAFKRQEMALVNMFNGARQALFDQGEIDRLVQRYGLGMYATPPITKP